MEREAAIRIFKCLSDASRLNIISALRNGEAYGELLAERLGLSASTLSFHMKKLEEAGLVTSRKEQYYTVYALDSGFVKLSLAELIGGECPKEEGEAQKREEAYRKKVLDAFFEGETLKQIPVQRKKKLICYEKIAERFEIGRIYEEKEVNAVISPVNEDYCTIRRDMISEGILKRENGLYTRLK